ncbi:FadR/GntR family transcriptional regulator [Flexivirga oryzae]|uniref:DNA-binding FadR family transcriptional regulator n=1 Tax=Flexivirga oryzae TaxID=1794944 RepID=A0A839NAE4_9MICO|nr:GntR family transcriptional regulator [Flexivirga oryzae]MBB2893799.1 DNA-binding FadR family transcriptional regulator [Flexivirga oryzae]
MRKLSGDARRAVFAPLDDGLVRSEAVVRRLTSAIHLGLLADGEQLPAETALADSLNVSTMTLRDALAELRDRGLVQTRRGRSGGSFVHVDPAVLDDLSRRRLEEIDSSDLRELSDAHSATCGAAARLAAIRASEAELGRLSDIVDNLDAAGDLSDRRRLDTRFCVEMAASSQSVRLTLAEIDIQAECAQFPWPAGDSDIRAAKVATGYREVVTALTARDGNLARSWTEETLAMQSSWLVERHLAMLTSRQRPASQAADDASPAPLTVSP